MKKLSHIDAKGEAKMVDISNKKISKRCAVAKGFIKMDTLTLDLIKKGGHKKGDVLATARLAGMMAAKQTATLIPLCHSLMLSSVAVDLTLQKNGIDIVATCRLDGKTGVEMEALTAVSVAALTLYDMCKAVDKAMEISAIKLLSKTGGRSSGQETEK